MFKNILRDIFYRKTFFIISFIWIIISLIWLNTFVGINGSFKNVINATFIGYNGLSIFFFYFLFLHGFIWYYVFNMLIEYTRVFFIYIYLKKNNIRKIIIEIILKSFLITSLYYIMLFLITYAIIKINPFDNLLMIKKDMLFDYNISFLLIEAIINSFVIEMILFLFYLLTKKFELALIFATSLVIIFNKIIVSYNNIREYIFSSTYYVGMLKSTVSEIKYITYSIGYLIIIIIILSIVIKNKLEKIVLGDYITNN